MTSSLHFLGCLRIWPTFQNVLSSDPTFGGELRQIGLDAWFSNSEKQEANCHFFHHHRRDGVVCEFQFILFIFAQF